MPRRNSPRKHTIGAIWASVALLAAFCLIGMMLISEDSSIKFSHESGFYKDSIFLELSVDDNSKIYYTLDGTEPNEFSNVYSKPIKISEELLSDNVYSMIDSTSVGFLEDLIRERKSTGEIPEYRIPDYSVDKCLVVRAVTIDGFGRKGVERTETYFMDKTPAEYDDCGVISLIINPEYLFDEKEGIYVTGQVFEDYMNNLGGISESWRCWEANYTQRGSKWERRAYVNVFDAQGNNTADESVGIRIHGGISRATLPKSLNLYGEHNYVLSAGGNQTITQFNDYMVSERLALIEPDVAYVSYRPYVLFIDGEYWGFYWASEKYDNQYFNKYYNVDPNNVIMVKDGAIELGEDEDVKVYREMVQYISNSDMSGEEEYVKAKQLVDMESLMDYYAIMLYIGISEDWPMCNVSQWRSRTIDDSSDYSDGKWRYIIYDCNSTSLGEMLKQGEQYDYNTLQYIINNDSLFSSLWKNESFQKEFIDRCYYIGNKCFDAEAMRKYIENYAKKMTPIMSKSWKRFYGADNNKQEEFEAKLVIYEDFFENRKQDLDMMFSDYIIYEK